MHLKIGGQDVEGNVEATLHGTIKLTLPDRVKYKKYLNIQNSCDVLNNGSIYHFITRNTLAGPAVRGQQGCGTNNSVTSPLADKTKATATLFTNSVLKR